MIFRILAFPAALLMLWGATAMVSASDQTGAKDSTGRTTSENAAAEMPAVVVPELKHEFEPVVDGTQITHDFVVKNTGEGPLAIAQVKTG